jgi:membrane peptidoglycan carboxypeptidase
LPERAGAAVAIDPRNGEVLAMVSVPNYDPNLFVNGIAKFDYHTLLNAEDRPLLNRALSGNFLPGSTVKPYVALAGLELGVRKPERHDRLDRRVPHSRDSKQRLSTMTALGAMAASTCARPSRSRSIRTSTAWRSRWASTASPARWQNSASARRPAST